jgi:spore maturation protein CgeB
MTAPKALLTGPQWFGDLLTFCERGLSELGVEVRVLATNQTEWLARATRWRAGLSHLPVIGPRCERRIERRHWEQVAGEVNQHLVKLVADWSPDVLISILCWGELLSYKALNTLRGVRKIGWLMDDPFQRDGRLVGMLGSFDRLYVVDDAWSAPIRLAVGRPVEWLSCGADLQSHYPLSNASIPDEYRGGIVFVGTSYHDQPAGLVRRVLLDEIADLDLRIYGDQGWTKMSAAVARCYRRHQLTSEQTNMAYNGADIVLNIHHPQFRSGTSLRTFAICASGAFQLVDWRSGLDQFLLPDQEIVTYSTPGELRKKTLYYLADAGARRHIARAGYERVRRDHTYRHRLAEILHQVGLLTAEMKASFDSPPSLACAQKA